MFISLLTLRSVGSYVRTRSQCACLLTRTVQARIFPFAVSQDFCAKVAGMLGMSDAGTESPKLKMPLPGPASGTAPTEFAMYL